MVSLTFKDAELFFPWGFPSARPTWLPRSTSTSERQDHLGTSRGEEYRRRAQACLDASHTTQNEATRVALLRLAEDWRLPPAAAKLANKVIEFTSASERNPDVLCERVFEDISPDDTDEH